MTYRVAITSSDGNHIDLHFGNSKYFYVLEIEETGKWKIIDLRNIDEKQVEAMGLEQGKAGELTGHNDVFLEHVSLLLSDCTYLLTSKIGKKPYKALQENNINSLEAPHDLSVAIKKVNNYHLKAK